MTFIVLCMALVIALGLQYAIYWNPSNPVCVEDVAGRLEPQNNNQLTQDFITLLESYRESETAPGLQATLITPKGQRISSAVGYVSASKNCPMTSEHFLYIGSVSKLVTSVLFHDLILSVEGTKEMILSSSFPTQQLPKDIRINELLHHTSGATELTYNPFFVFKLFQPAYGFSTKEVAKASDRFSLKTRGEYNYTNSNFMLLGRFLELKTGNSIDDLLAQQFPINTDISIFWKDVPESIAIPRAYDQDVIPFPTRLDMTPFRKPYTSGGFSAAGFLSDTNSLANFVDRLFSSSRGRKNIELYTYLSDTVPASEHDQPYLVAYGSGTRVLDINGERWIGHTGTQTGYSGMAFHNLDKDYSIALTANLSQINQMVFLESLQEFIASEF